MLSFFSSYYWVDRFAGTKYNQVEENEIIQRTIFYVQQTLKDSERGHDWFHVWRVYRQANLIAAYEPGDKLVIRLGALLQDIADSQISGG